MRIRSKFVDDTIQFWPQCAKCEGVHEECVVRGVELCCEGGQENIHTASGIFDRQELVNVNVYTNRQGESVHMHPHKLNSWSWRNE